MHIRRRSLLAASALLPLAACGAVTVTTANGVTTVKINTASIDAWGQAAINAATMLAPLAGAAAPAILAIGGVARVDLAAFDKASAGSVTLTFDRGSPPAAVASVLADARNLLTAAQPVIPAKSGTAAATYLSALAVIVSTAEAAVGVAPTAVAARLSAERPMTEGEALTALGVKAR